MPKTRMPEYGVWWQMISRCTDPTSEYYHRYGGRGIKVCKRWRASFRNFLADVGQRPTPQHTIERIKNGKGYFPGNVKWATRTEQARNRDTNVFLVFNGQRKTIAEWGEITGLGGKLIWQRINDLGWSVEKALTTPADSRPKNTPITAFGETKTAQQWSAKHGVPAYQIRRRILNEWDTERAVSEPMRPRSHRTKF